MSIEDLKFVFKERNRSFYNFVYCLIPDDLQVSQIITDATALLVSEHHALLQDFLNSKGEIQNQLRKKIIKQTYRYLYQITERRFEQVKDSVFPIQETSKKDEDYSEFYSLNFTFRAILSLGQKHQFAVKDISFVTGLRESEIENCLREARVELVQSLRSRPSRIERGSRIG